MKDILTFVVCESYVISFCLLHTEKQLSKTASGQEEEKWAQQLSPLVQNSVSITVFTAMQHWNQLYVSETCATCFPCLLPGKYLPQTEK